MQVFEKNTQNNIVSKISALCDDTGLFRWQNVQKKCCIFGVLGKKTLYEYQNYAIIDANRSL